MGEENVSYWNQTCKKQRYPKLESDLETDILIIGGGITGITCAYTLTQKDAKPVLIEAGSLCGGTTGNTTGKVTLSHGIIYSTLIGKYGRKFASNYAQSQEGVLNYVRKLVRRNAIDCQLADCTAYIYASEEQDKETVRAEYDAAAELGLDVEYFEKPDFPGENYGMVGFKNQAVFHPVRYAEAVAAAAVSAGAEIYCGTKAVSVENGDVIRVACENGVTIRAKHLVMATQYPIYDGPNVFFTRLYAKRAYGMAVKAEGNWPDGSYINVSGPTRSIRTHIEDGKRILIVVGENHATGRGDESMELHYEKLAQFASTIGGRGKELARWSAQDYDTPDQVPYICRLSDDSEIYAAAGFGKWGLTNGTLAGNMIAEMILNGHCKYEEIYSRKRHDYSSSAGKAVSEVFGSVGELIKSKFEETEDLSNLEPGEGRVIRYRGERAGIYRDNADNVVILDISCRHMSTELNFNSAEKTWDCPAHGGRYGIDGRLLEGPPKDPLKVLFKGKISELDRHE